MLRIDINIVFTIINLLILYVLMKKFLFKPVREILQKRSDEIDASFAEADQKNKEAEELKAQYEQSLASVDAEKTQAIEEAKQKAGVEYDRIIEDANKKSEAIVAQAHDKAAAEAEEQKRAAVDDIAEMVKKAAGKVVAAEDDKDLYDAFLNKVEKE